MEPLIELSQEFLLRPTLEGYSIVDQINIQNIHHIYNNLDTCPPLNNNSKNNSLSLKSRKRGNELFIKKHVNNETLIAYNESIAYAECTNDTEFLSISFANRSALLYEMGYFKECIQDITRARSYNYPKHLLPKLEKRYERAKENEANSKVFSFHKMTPPMKSSTHKFLKCASDAIEIEYNDRYGRNIIATQDIDVGDVLSIEEPYAKYLFHDSRHEYCNYCFEKTLTLIPCDHCCDAMFCNEICKNTAWNKGIHKYVCKLPTSVVNTYDSTVVMAFYAAIKDLLDIVINEENEKQLRTFTDVKVHGLTIRDGVIVHDVEPDLSVYSVVGEKDFILGQRCSDVAKLLKLIETRSTFLNDLQHYFDTDDLKKKIIDFTYSHISVFTPMTVVSLKNNRLGEAMLPFNKLLNHSCFRNVILVWYGSTAVARCVRPIKRNESLFCSYLDNDYTNLHIIVRQAKLFDMFKFECNCVACFQNWPPNDCVQIRAVLSKLMDKKYPEIAEENVTLKYGSEQLKKQLTSYPPNDTSVIAIKFISGFLLMLGNSNSF